MFVSSHIAVTNRIEQLSLMCYNETLTKELFSHRFVILKKVFGFVESQIFSRVVGSLISIAAGVETAFHLIALPFTCIYALGKSIYLRQNDFSLPLQHLQRVRDAIFPLLFGSLFGFIHPYLGTYAAEPAKKHIATGLFLSGTNEAEFDTVCSPLTMMQEVKSLFSEIQDPSVAPIKEEIKILSDIHFWESEFEKIQSIDFFHLNLTYKVGHKIVKAIEDADLSPIVKEIAKRIVPLVYPVLILADTLVSSIAMLVCLGSLAVQLLGGQSPAYLEEAGSLEVLIYNLVKIPIFLVGAVLGTVVSLVQADIGLACMAKPTDWMAKTAFKIKMLALRTRIKRMHMGEYMVLPAVETYAMEERGEYPLLPSYGSHMRYLLLEKTAAGFEAEMIERGLLNKRTSQMTFEEMFEMTKDVLSLRFHFHTATTEAFKKHADKDGTVDLGRQTGINNCVVTNLFAAIQVMRHKTRRNNFELFCALIKEGAAKRYYHYAPDFYPFGNTQEIMKEINSRFSSII